MFKLYNSVTHLCITSTTTFYVKNLSYICSKYYTITMFVIVNILKNGSCKPSQVYPMQFTITVAMLPPYIPSLPPVRVTSLRVQNFKI